MTHRLAKPLAALVVLAIFVAMGREVIWKWMFSYHWVPQGYSLAINRKTGKPAAPEHWAGVKEAGNLEWMAGPGRQFFNPWDYDVRLVEDVVVPPNSVLLVETLLGDKRPQGQVLAEPNQQGVQRAVQTPGVWRNNPLGMKAGRDKIIPAVVIEPGYVGVVRRLVEPNKGVRKEVLPAGIYYNNPVEQEIIPVEVGYSVWEAHSEVEVARVAGRSVAKIKPGTGLSVNLADGKPMIFDMTVVYGIWPEDAPYVVQEYGTTDMIETNIVIPQVYSNTQNIASNYTTREMIEGNKREEFMAQVTNILQQIGKQKRIHFRFVLIRDFHPSEDIVETIQGARLAEEEKTTLQFEQERDKVSAELTNAEQIVSIRLADFDAETSSLVQTERQTGMNRAAATRAEADAKVAEIRKQTALVDSEITKILGEAEAKVIEADKLADAKSDQMMIAAYGGPDAYNKATFAEGLPTDLVIDFRYAGPGTLYTGSDADLVGLAARQMLAQPATRPAR